jgi:hypothetical protein
VSNFALQQDAKRVRLCMKSRRVEYEAATELVCGGCVCLCSGEHVRQSCGSEQCSSCVCVCVCVCVCARAKYKHGRV